MKLSEYVWTLVQAYNPNRYETILERPRKELVLFFAYTLLIGVVLFICTIVPVTFHYISTIPDRTAELTTLQLDATVESEAPVVLLDRPSIVIDLDANHTRNGDFVLSRDGLLYPRFVFFGTTELPWSDVKDLKSQTFARDRFLSSVILFLLPSMIFWFVLYGLLKLLLIALALFLLGLLLPLLFKHRIRARDVLGILVLSLPSLIVMDLGLYPIAPLFWWGVILTGIFFFLGIAVVSERVGPDSSSRDGFGDRGEHHKHKRKV